MRNGVKPIMLVGILILPLWVGDFQAKAEDGGAGKQTLLADQEAKRRKELENTEWQITLIPENAKNEGQESGESGSLVFQNKTVSFKGFKHFDIGAIGYTLTAYTDSDKGTWETFKTTKDGNISIRGDWEGQMMNGVTSEQLDGGKTIKIQRFTSVNAVKPVEESKPAPAEKKIEGISDADSAGISGTRY